MTFRGRKPTSSVDLSRASELPNALPFSLCVYCIWVVHSSTPGVANLLLVRVVYFFKHGAGRAIVFIKHGACHMIELHPKFQKVSLFSGGSIGGRWGRPPPLTELK